MKIDLHIHTKYSYDTRLPIEKIVKIAGRRGLDGIAITDHDNFEGVKAARRMEFDNFSIVEGEEITSDRGDILALFIQEEIESRNHLEVIDEIKDRGGLAVIPHPFDKYRGEHFRDVEEVKDKIDGLEVFNGRSIYGEANKKANKFVEKWDLIKTAGSDSHTRFGIGNGYVEVQASNLEEFREKLEKGEVKIGGEKSNFLVHLISKINSKIPGKSRSRG